ncbi:DUF3299 domain-containing protein [Halochromatium sp.]
MEEITALWKQAPVVEELDGKRVKRHGFVVPWSFDLYELSAFLLVPFFCACIHVPPRPAANQIVYDALPEGKRYRSGVFNTVSVMDDLRVEPFSRAMGDAGYRLEALAIVPYP